VIYVSCHKNELTEAVVRWLAAEGLDEEVGKLADGQPVPGDCKLLVAWCGYHDPKDSDGEWKRPAARIVKRVFADEIACPVLALSVAQPHKDPEMRRQITPLFAAERVRFLRMQWWEVDGNGRDVKSIVGEAVADGQAGWWTAFADATKLAVRPYPGFLKSLKLPEPEVANDGDEQLHAYRVFACHYAAHVDVDEQLTEHRVRQYETPQGLKAIRQFDLLRDFHRLLEALRAEHALPTNGDTGKPGTATCKRTVLVIDDRPGNEFLCNAFCHLSEVLPYEFIVTAEDEYKHFMPEKIRLTRGQVITCGQYRFLKGTQQPKRRRRVDLSGIDVALVDLKLADARGEDVLRCLYETHPEIVAFAFSWQEDPKVIRETLSEYADDYLPKRGIYGLPGRVRHCYEEIWPIPEALGRERYRRLVASVRRWQKEPGILWHGEKTFHLAEHSLQHHLNVWAFARRLIAGNWTGTLRSRFEKLENLRPGSGWKAEDYLFFLLMSVWLHDIGSKGNARWNQPHQVRKFHALIACDLLRTARERQHSTGKGDEPGLLRGTYGLEENEVEPVSRLCGYHQSNAPLLRSDLQHPTGKKREGIREYSEFFRNDDFCLEISYPDLVPLAALLRLLDAMDSHWRRVGSATLKEARQASIESDVLYYKERRGLLRRLGINDTVANAYARDLTKQEEEHYRKHYGVLDSLILSRLTDDDTIVFCPCYRMRPNHKSQFGRITCEIRKEWEATGSWLTDHLGLRLANGREAEQLREAAGPRCDGYDSVFAP